MPTDDSFAIIISNQFQRKDFEMVNRRSFLSGSALVAAAVVAPAQAAEAPKKVRKPFEGIGDAPFVVGEP